MPFITFEGIDQSGKSTQMELLEGALKKAKVSVVTVREPGGTELGEKLRDILLGPDHPEMDEWAETLLYAAARAQLAVEKIRPALAKGSVVLSDRFFDSSLTYQGIARGLGVMKVLEVNLRATRRLIPDLTFILHLDVDKSRARLSEGKGKADRIEGESLEFHRKVEKGYQRLEKMFPERMVGLDGAAPVEEVQAQIAAACRERLGLEF